MIDGARRAMRASYQREFDSLECFDFGRHDFRVITCEHNYSSTREKVHRLLSGHGYERKYAELSKWDDWYVRP